MLRTDANASLLGLLAATVLFAVSFATIVNVSVHQEDGARNSLPPDRQALAASLADLLLANPGKGWYSAGEACNNGTLNASAWTPELVLRLGLAEERCAVAGEARERLSNLSFGKLQNLHGALYEADPTNGAVDYSEARRSLHLDEAGVHFHVRSWPLLPEVGRMLKSGYRDPYLSPLYVGDYDRLQGGQAATLQVRHTAGFVDASSSLRLFVNITNNGTSTTAFSVAFDVPARRSLLTEMHSGQVPPGESWNVTFRLNKTSDWAWKDAAKKRFDYVIRGPSVTLGQGSAALPDPTAAAARTLYAVESDRLEWDADDADRVSVAYGAFDGEGQPKSTTGWTLDIVDAAGAIVATASNLKAKGGTADFDLQGRTGLHYAVLRAPGGWEVQRDVVSLVTADTPNFETGPEPGQWVPAEATLRESALVDAVIQAFDRGVVDPEFHDGALAYFPEGEVFPADNRLLADRLPLVLRDPDGAGSLDTYNLLIIGSNVDHRSLTSAAIKHTIRDWVLAGGTLIVFGSANQAVQWLEPLFHVALQGAGGDLFTPDEHHPLLHTPHRLSPQAYDDHGTAWHFNREADREHFTHVVQSGPDDIVAVSDPGAFGKGRIILTAWQAWDLTPGDPPPECAPAALEASCAALQVFVNFITLAYHGLYLDYGPAIPDGVPQGVQSRISTVWHPQMRRLVDLYVLVYVFG